MHEVTRHYIEALVKDAYSMNLSIQKMLTVDEYEDYVSAVEHYSKRKLKGKAFYITMCDNAYVLAAKKYKQPNMEQYLEVVRVLVKKVEKLDDGNLELMEALGKLEEAVKNTEISAPTIYQYSLNPAEEHSVKEWTTLLQDHLAFLKEAESHFSSFQKFKDTEKWKFISEFSLLGKVYAKMMPIIDTVLDEPDRVVYDSLRKALEKDSAISCNNNCRIALEVLSEGAIEDRCSYVAYSAYESAIYDIAEAAQEAYTAGVKNILQSLVKSGCINESQASIRLKTEVDNWDVDAFISDVLFERLVDRMEKLSQDEFYC